jgi:methylated-DNA-[protein]-cysteine S-methyltransferase
VEKNMIRIDEVESPIGTVFLQLEGESLKALRFDTPFSGERAAKSVAAERVRAYFAGDLKAFEGLTLAADGTEFQRKVWQLLMEIPAGETRTYGQLAVQIGSHPRAVGSANGSNPIAIVVPCHRVIGADASLTGFGGGIERKRWLLTYEGAYPPARAEAQLTIGL